MRSNSAPIRSMPTNTSAAAPVDTPERGAELVRGVVAKLVDELSQAELQSGAASYCSLSSGCSLATGHGRCGVKV